MLNFKSYLSEEITEDELQDMANRLSWEDIYDLYAPEDLEQEIGIEIKEETLDEKISASSRMKKHMDFARSAAKRNIARSLKLKRASDINTLKKRANLAARRALMKRLLRGRSKDQLSAIEKDRLETKLKSMEGIVNNLSQK
ncbi:hypothetical protein EBR43_10600, partial [bacterium]|nr:hypothetical protein [bacterium]